MAADAGKDPQQPEAQQLLFCHTFRHLAVSPENVQSIYFAAPVRVSTVWLLFPGASASIGARQYHQGDTRPPEAKIGVWAVDKGSPKQSSYVRLATLPDAGGGTIAALPPGRIVVTDHVLVRGNYRNLTIALYGNIVDESSRKKLQQMVTGKKGAGAALAGLGDDKRDPHNDAVTTWTDEQIGAQVKEACNSGHLHHWIYDGKLERPDVLGRLSHPGGLVLHASDLAPADVFHPCEKPKLAGPGESREEWERDVRCDAVALCLILARFAADLRPAAVPQWVPWLQTEGLGCSMEIEDAEDSCLGDSESQWDETQGDGSAPATPVAAPAGVAGVSGPDTIDKQARGALHGLVGLLLRERPSDGRSRLQGGGEVAYDGYVAEFIAQQLPVVEVIALLLSFLLEERPEVSAAAARAAAKATRQSQPESPAEPLPPIPETPNIVTAEVAFQVLLRLAEHPPLADKLRRPGSVTWGVLRQGCLNAGAQLDPGAPPGAQGDSADGTVPHTGSVADLMGAALSQWAARNTADRLVPIVSPMAADARRVGLLFDTVDALCQFGAAAQPIVGPAGCAAAAELDRWESVHSCLSELMGLANDLRIFLPDSGDPRYMPLWLWSSCRKGEWHLATHYDYYDNAHLEEPFDLTRHLVSVGFVPLLGRLTSAAVLWGRCDADDCPVEIESCGRAAAHCLLRLLACRQGLALLAQHPQTMSALCDTLRCVYPAAIDDTDVSRAVHQHALCSFTGVGSSPPTARINNVYQVLADLLPLHLKVFGVFDTLVTLSAEDSKGADGERGGGEGDGQGRCTAGDPALEAYDSWSVLYSICRDSDAGKYAVSQLLMTKAGSATLVRTVNDSSQADSEEVQLAAHVLTCCACSEWGPQLVLALEDEEGRRVCDRAILWLRSEKHTTTSAKSATETWTEVLSFTSPAALLAQSGVMALIAYTHRTYLRLAHCWEQLNKPGITTLRSLDPLITEALTAFGVCAQLSENNDMVCILLVRRGVPDHEELERAREREVRGARRYAYEGDRRRDIVALAAQVLLRVTELVHTQDLRWSYAALLGADVSLSHKHCLIQLHALRVILNVLREVRRAAAVDDAGGVVFRCPLVASALAESYVGLVFSHGLFASERSSRMAAARDAYIEYWGVAVNSEDDDEEQDIADGPQGLAEDFLQVPELQTGARRFDHGKSPPEPMEPVLSTALENPRKLLGVLCLFTEVLKELDRRAAAAASGGAAGSPRRKRRRTELRQDDPGAEPGTVVASMRHATLTVVRRLVGTIDRDRPQSGKTAAKFILGMLHATAPDSHLADSCPAAASLHAELRKALLGGGAVWRNLLGLLLEDPQVDYESVLSTFDHFTRIPIKDMVTENVLSNIELRLRQQPPQQDPRTSLWLWLDPEGHREQVETEEYRPPPAAGWGGGRAGRSFRDPLVLNTSRLPSRHVDEFQAAKAPLQMARAQDALEQPVDAHHPLLPILSSRQASDAAAAAAEEGAPPAARSAN
eukprot:TRINITY_DN55187_c0_g1_i1.p1 TRINITY_DN55187_c0_g1~~TRINITY_DN55187_c0_g1_i1.p1  ORF type:complete len:1492 (+),score=465.64 TRINITY_DN55187_c0_g1_i1:77-4552(+)